LTRVQFEGGHSVAAAIGLQRSVHALRVRVRRDVQPGAGAAARTSILNVLPAKLLALRDDRRGTTLFISICVARACWR